MQASSSEESQIKRNPHGDFKQVEESRPDFNGKIWKYTKVPDPNWRPGNGANDSSQVSKTKIELDPYSGDRNPVDNYKLLISAITPRPIGFISTVGSNGTRNLSPFSYFNFVNHDPPIFTVGFSSPKSNPKDTLKNLLETEECTVNIISEWFIEAANYTCLNAPYEIDEWELSGLTPMESSKVKAPHVKESAFSVECKLVHTHEWTSRANPLKKTGSLCILEGINFHIGANVVNEDLNNIDISKLKPVSRLGGITYGRVIEGFELPRPNYEP